MQMNGWKLVMQLETETGSELLLTHLMSFTLAWQLSKLVWSNNKRLSERERMLKLPCFPFCAAVFIHLKVCLLPVFKLCKLSFG